MWGENVEFVRREIEALNNGHIDAMLAGMDRDVVWENPEVPGVATYKGHDGIRDFFDAVTAPWDPYWLVPEWFVEAQSRVVVIGRVGGQGTDNGVRVGKPFAAVCTLRAGQIVHIAGYFDQQRALSVGRLDR